MDKNTFCVAPWLAISVNEDKALTPCCYFKTKSNYSYENSKEYFHSNELKAVRKDLLNGIKNSSCDRCWVEEENGKESLRQIFNKSLAKESEVSLKEQIENPKFENVQSFNLVLGNLCNLKCTMCSPRNSSQLYAEMNVNQSLRQFHRTHDLKSQKFYNWPKERNFVEWCETNLHNSIYLQLTGGEPFIVPWVPDVLDKIPDEQKARCILNITTNLTVMNQNLIDIFKKFKEVWLSVSCEGIEETFEYIRFGHLWETFEKNLKQIMNSRTKLGISYVIQAPSFASIPKMVDYFDNLELKIFPIYLRSPAHFHISVLSKDVKQNLLNHFKDYKGFNKEFVKFTTNYVQENISGDKNLVDYCKKHLSAFDQVRKTDYTKIIPVDSFA